MEKIREIDNYVKGKKNKELIMKAFIKYIEDEMNFRSNNIPNLEKLLDYHVEYTLIYYGRDFREKLIRDTIGEIIVDINHKCFKNMVNYFMKFYYNPYNHNNDISNKKYGKLNNNFRADYANVDNMEQNDCWNLTDQNKNQFNNELIKRATNKEGYFNDRMNIHTATPYDDLQIN